MARSRSCGRASVTSSSPMMTRRSTPASSPAIIRRSVVFPQPEGPTSTMNSPSADLEADVVDGLDLAGIDLRHVLEAECRVPRRASPRRPSRARGRSAPSIPSSGDRRDRHPAVERLRRRSRRRVGDDGHRPGGRTSSDDVPTKSSMTPGSTAYCERRGRGTRAAPTGTSKVTRLDSPGCELDAREALQLEHRPGDARLAGRARRAGRPRRRRGRRCSRCATSTSIEPSGPTTVRAARASSESSKRRVAEAVAERVERARRASRRSRPSSASGRPRSCARRRRGSDRRSAG